MRKLIAILFLMTFICTSLHAEADLSDLAVLTEMTEMAEHGYADAQLTLGDWYFNGNQVSKDYAAAAKYYEMGAEQGEQRAQCILGGMYLLGKGLKKDKVQASHWLGLAADQGMREAQVMLKTLKARSGPKFSLSSAQLKNKKPIISSLQYMAR